MKISLKKGTRDQRRGSTIKKRHKGRDVTNLKNNSWSSFLYHENTKHELTLYLLPERCSEFCENFDQNIYLGIARRVTIKTITKLVT